MPENTMNNHLNKINRCSIINTRNWADLPKELLEKIGNYLNFRIDVLRYRAVCSSWRSAIFLSPPSSTGIHAFINTVTIFRLEHNHHNCLVKLVETAEGKFGGLNPLTIPKKDWILGKSLNLWDCRLIELGKVLHFGSSIEYGELNVKKAVVLRDCGILAIYDDVKLGFRGFGDEYWTNLCLSPYFMFLDISVCQGEYYVLDTYGNVHCIDKFMNVVKHLPGLKSLGQVQNLVESEGQLYVVDAYSRRSIDFEESGLIDTGFDKVDMKVYKFDENLGMWVQVTSLNDRVFVLGKDVCFSVSVNDFPGREIITDICRPNRSFRRRDARSPSYLRYYDAEIGYYVPRVFKLEDHSMRDVEGSLSFKQLFSPPKECFYSTLSFP
ncbi:putative F-box protein At1g65770 [Chenopodium quinoa]|uniref:putative F-box protein At1g65770 n=1 Tax=Chenopodium quinoa TaxID=63459 RepID=UPI000B77A9E3|nr:putative F-box protein At1g65770 [Chenopodium quinoa]